jgi:hypothetical protein
MLPADPPIPAARYGQSRRGRGISFILAMLTSLGLFLIIMLMGRVTDFGEPGGGNLVAINISGPKGEKEKAAAKQQKSAKTPQAAQSAVQPPMPPRVVIPSPKQVEWPPGFIKLSRDDLAKGDISKIKGTGVASAASGEAGGGGAQGNGDGPGGAKLYNAQWYREPRDGELAGYLPAGRSPGDWAEIVCRTIEQYHVEDCRELGESPRGSGTARALRQAAWQFLVRPPRVDGKPQLGTWVRIHFEFRKAKREEAGAVAEGE